MSSTISTTIQAICAKGYQEYSQKNYPAALRLFYQAWLQLPKPQSEHADAEIILSSIGDTYYQMGKYETAIEALRSALSCQESDKRAFVLLRLGQALLDSNHEPQAKTYLHRAYRLHGSELFDDELPKYKKAISDLI